MAAPERSGAVDITICAKYSGKNVAVDPSKVKSIFIWLVTVLSGGPASTGTVGGLVSTITEY